jgi:hypothetical protein
LIAGTGTVTAETGVGLASTVQNGEAAVTVPVKL